MECCQLDNTGRPGFRIKLLSLQPRVATTLGDAETLCFFSRNNKYLSTIYHRLHVFINNHTAILLTCLVRTAYTKLKAKIKQHNPLDYVPCSAHSLNLVGKQQLIVVYKLLNILYFCKKYLLFLTLQPKDSDYFFAFQKT